MVLNVLGFVWGWADNRHVRPVEFPDLLSSIDSTSKYLGYLLSVMFGELKMATELQYVENIISELDSIQGIRTSDLIAEENFSFPSFIPAGEGKCIQTNQKIEKTLLEFAKALKNARPSTAKSVRDKEWVDFVRTTIGPKLASVDLAADRSEQASEVLGSLKRELDELLINLGKQEHTFGCDFIEIKDFEPLVIGAVRIEHRTGWLSRVRGAGYIDQFTQKRVTRAWDGQQLRPRNKPKDEDAILETIAGHSFVVSVSVTGHASKAGKEQAILASKLVLTGLSLFWSRPSVFLRGARLSCQRGEWVERSISFHENNSIGYSISRHGLQVGVFLSSDEWRQMIDDHQDFLSVISEVVDLLLSESKPENGREKVLNAVLQSLLWLHQACTQENPTFSLVAIAAALDSLAGGKKAKGIMALVNAQLRIPDEKRLYEGGPTLNEFITDLFNQGRSRFVHGTSDKIGHDWSTTLGTAESLTRHTLYSCIMFIAKKPLISSVDQLKEMTK